jgi:hypothetical protein
MTHCATPSASDLAEGGGGEPPEMEVVTEHRSSTTRRWGHRRVAGWWFNTGGGGGGPNLGFGLPGVVSRSDLEYGGAAAVSSTWRREAARQGGAAPL